MTAKTKKIRTLKGVVVSDKMDKTVTVLVSRFILHKKYQKRYKVSKKFTLHDPKNEGKVGQTVEFQPCRPISKNKRWLLTKVIN